MTKTNIPNIRALLCPEVPLCALQKHYEPSQRVFYANIREIPLEVARYAVEHPKERVYVADPQIQRFLTLDIPLPKRNDLTDLLHFEEEKEGPALQDGLDLPLIPKTQEAQQIP
ncbi:hypothetical protein D6774_03410 [Candidatus Woesearchaeota archaeon]|nr:MAG: hypothetical protein D6774_03410 [Candidatus Woesearchaeota archaeon]